MTSSTATDSQRPDVLVLDADQASALAIVRALAPHGIRVHVAASTDGGIAACSRHVASKHRYPDPLRDADGFLAWIAARQRSHPDELIFPVTERSLVPLLRGRARLPQAQRVAMAPPEALDQVLDKSRTVALAERLGVRVPLSWPLNDEAGLSSFEQAMAGPNPTWRFPVVVKPARSVGGTAQASVQLSVSYAHTPAQLRAQVQQALRHGGAILQEYFQGDGVGIELIADRGEICHAFQHRRLHEVPLTGGGSSLRISEQVVPVLLEASRELVRALGWHGVAMVEFKYDPKRGDYRLMEINGRFWGSLPLAVAAGANFPLMLYELMCAGRVQPRAPARPGVVCRQLARDLLWLEHVLRRAAPPELVRLPSRGQVLRDCALVLSPRHHFDVQSLSDPWPGLVDVARIVRGQWSRLRDMQRQRRQRQAAWREAQAHWRTMAAPAQRQGSPRQVLFLCYGNINRSALAQAHAVQTGLAEAAGWQVASAGFHTPAGRPADSTMVAVAAGSGTDLQHWRSHTLDAAQVDQADLILAMEVAHLDRLLCDHPQAKGKAFLLGAVNAATAAQCEIADPYGQPRATYEAVCKQVRQAVDTWLGATARAARPNT